jgi:hypothetical protein
MQDVPRKQISIHGETVTASGECRRPGRGCQVHRPDKQLSRLCHYGFLRLSKSLVIAQLSHEWVYYRLHSITRAILSALIKNEWRMYRKGKARSTFWPGRDTGGGLPAAAPRVIVARRCGMQAGSPGVSGEGLSLSRSPDDGHLFL